jgi:hypothetical protein
MRKFLRATALWILLLPYVATYTGAALNQLVIIANHDRFPVMGSSVKITKWGPDENGMLDATHCLMTKDTHLNFLADIFDLGGSIYSVGDGLIYLGEWLGEFCPFVFITVVIMKLKSHDSYGDAPGY